MLFCRIFVLCKITARQENERTGCMNLAMQPEYSGYLKRPAIHSNPP